MSVKQWIETNRAASTTTNMFSYLQEDLRMMQFIKFKVTTSMYFRYFGLGKQHVSVDKNYMTFQIKTK